jgi:hypothetical protein
MLLLSESSSSLTLKTKQALPQHLATSNSSSEEESPVDYVRSLFPDNMQRVRSHQICQRSEEEMEHYDMAVVSAIRNKDVHTLRTLWEQGHCMDASNRCGETLLHLACRRGDLATVQFLIEEAGVSPDVCDNLGRSIVHDACWKSVADVELMDVLIRSVSPHMFLAQDMRGHTPFDFARKQHWGVWNKFLRHNRSLLEKRIQLVSSSAEPSN